MKRSSLAALLAVTIAPAAQARPLTNLELYRRCFAQLTGQRLDLNDALTKAVIAGTTSPTAACGQVLDSAVLSSVDTANAAIRLPTTAPAYAQAVLQNMHKLHNSFFQVKDFIPADGLRPTRSKGTMDLFDNSTPAMYLTRALLSPTTAQGAPQYPFAGIVAGKDILGALRTNMDPSTGPRTGYPKSFYSMTGSWKYAPTGQLLGFRTLQPSTMNFYDNTSHGGASDDADEYSNFTLPLSGSQVRDGTLGAGILGNYVYVMLNVQGAVTFDKYAGIDDNGLPRYLSNDFLSDGAVRMPRKWGRAVYHDFLCRDLPAVRPGDGDAFLETDPSSAPFRQSTTCLQCHSSMDRTSSVVRHIVYLGFGTGPEISSSTGSDWYRGYETVNFKATTGSAPFSWPNLSDTTFSTKAPAGVLFFRNYEGNLVDTPVQDIDALGAAIANQDDMYLCAAQRYFQHFTGIVANIGDVDPTTLSSGDVSARNTVITLGKNLRTTNDLRQLVKDILALPLYRDSSYLVAP